MRGRRGRRAARKLHQETRRSQEEMAGRFVDWMNARPYADEPPVPGFYVENCEKHGGWTHLASETWEHQDDLIDQLEERDDLFLISGLYVGETVEGVGLPVKPVLVLREGSG